MLYVAVLWIIFAFLSFGVLGFNYVMARKTAKKHWNVKIDKDYRPKISVIVPTYNEGEVIGYKLRNLTKLEYPRQLMQLVFVDSKSADSTADLIKRYAEEHPEVNVKILETERRGKSSALNIALKDCSGDVIVVSDADCFYMPEILTQTLPFLADNTVGAVSGPKTLLNPNDSWVTKAEDRYLRSMNLMKLADSKQLSTAFFEGGFSAYRKDVLESFDKYNTGSDDCGTVLGVIEKDFRTLMVPEAQFFTAFPRTWAGKIEMKIRRASQLVRVFRKYAVLLLRGRVKAAKWIVFKDLLLYFLAPISFLFLVATTIVLMWNFPWMVLLLLPFLIPRIRDYFTEATLSYLILLLSLVLVPIGKEFKIWKKPQDRKLVTDDVLLKKGLI
jgi:cellulose synthase/poly-beta-1,6-N-acetylglucosamine synthase-like glycosyltransferase